MRSQGRRFDVEFFQGLWYEIANVGALFEEICTDVTAEYRVLDDAHLAFTNTCETLLGRWQVRGLATPTPDPLLFDVFLDGAPPGQLRVLWWSDSYSVALLGSGDKTMWRLLSRSPVQNRALVEAMADRAGAKGYRRGPIRWMRHHG